MHHGSTIAIPVIVGWWATVMVATAIIVMMVLPICIGVPYKITAFVVAVTMSIIVTIVNVIAFVTMTMAIAFTAEYVVTLVTMTVLVIITGKYKIAFITVTMMVTLTSESIPTNITSGWTTILATSLVTTRWRGDRSAIIWFTFFIDC
jgi:curli biogenesis system outer membrane secretion channel CsgG